MDIQTGELMGRYVSEARDTGRRLRACYGQVRANMPANMPALAMSGASGGAGGIPADLDDRLCRLEAAIALRGVGEPRVASDDCRLNTTTAAMLG